MTNVGRILLLQEEARIWVGEGQGAGMLSFKSQRKLRPVELSNTASVGKLGKRHPDSTPERDRSSYEIKQQENIHKVKASS